MESGSLSTKEFAAWTEDVIPFLHVTTRIPDWPGDGMLREYGGRGLPTLLFLDADGKKLSEPPGRDVATFASTATALGKVSDLKARVAKGEKGLEGKLLAAELELGTVDFPNAKARLAKIKKLDDETKAKITKLMVDAEILHLFTEAGRDQEKLAAARTRMAEMLRAGKMPGTRAESRFWSSIMQYADENGDAELFEKAVNWAKAKYADEPRAKTYLENLEKKLAELKEGKKEEPKP